MCKVCSFLYLLHLMLLAFDGVILLACISISVT
jgi:hypothetical protein